jgi:hypothetical protein
MRLRAVSPIDHDRVVHGVGSEFELPPHFALQLLASGAAVAADGAMSMPGGAPDDPDAPPAESDGRAEGNAAPARRRRR